jgi:hypothetical protein
MGEIADDVISGHCCSWCGVYFEDEHGYPVVCHFCSKGCTQDMLEIIGLHKATLPEL